ncbi:DNA-deoxyinosine glycosylase [Thiomicrorhabdus hydrogeniphila]
MNQNHCKSFSYIASEDPHWMILGTMPSVESLNQAFYYAHPRNAFWPIMCSLVNHTIQTQEDKTQLVKLAGLVLWDVLASCDRPGSLDSAIKQPVANDFEQLFNRFPNIKTVVFNGQKAQQLFKQHVLKKQNLPADIQYIVLPSTSPANAAMKFKDKQLFWQEKLSHLV